jgi:hypothetical protein
MFRSGAPFTVRQRAILEGTAQNVAHSAVLDLLEKCVRENGLTRAQLARTIGRDPSLITRWLGSPGNWTFATLGLLMGAMGHLPTIGAQSVEDIVPSKNYYNPAADLGSAPRLTIKSDPASGVTTLTRQPSSEIRVS